MEEEMITITLKEYSELCDRDAFLSCLEGAGVDNWDGYSDAWEMYRELDEEDAE